MVRPDVAAARNRGASSLAAVAYQKSPSVIPERRTAPLHSQLAMRCAPAHVAHDDSGDQPAPGRPVLAVGSKTHTCPLVSRHPIVSRNRSVFTLVASTGPSHSSRAGTATPVVLRVWVGPTTSTVCPGSAASSERPQ